MARKSTIKLLLINESDNDSERLISLFRNAGRVARVHRAVSAEDLHKSLENESWDLLIANDKHPEIAVEQCLEFLRKSSTDIPAIVIRDSDVQGAIDAGAADVIGSEDDRRLVFAAFREIQHLENSRELTQLKAKLADAEERCALLMGQSPEAIAYVADGMVINATSPFCARFGYDNPDDLDCAPIIDLISANDLEKFKGLLKSQQTRGEGNTDFSFTGVTRDGDNFPASMQLTSAVYDDEPCIQLSIRDQGATTTSSNNQNSPSIDPLTGLYSQNYFLAQLDSLCKQAANGNSISSLLFIGIDQFTRFRSRYGITKACCILQDLAKFIQHHSTDTICLAHFCDDGFTLLLADTNEEQAKEYAQSLCQKLEHHIIDVDGQSLQCTASIGLFTLNGQIPIEPSQLIDHVFNSCEQLREETNKEGVGNGVKVYIPTPEKKSLGAASSDEDLDSFLQEALEEGKFLLQFQPVISLRGSSGDHYEVQTLMRDDEGKLQHANEFLQNLRFNQVNTRLDRWIIIEATKQLAAKLDNNSDTQLFINLTTNALQDESLIPWLSVALKAAGIPPAALSFQFAENDINDYLKSAKRFAQATRELGCNISIAGFGQTDNPVKTLKQVDANFAKIAPKYSNQLESGGGTEELKEMVNSINACEAQAIISGVENAAALAVLWQIGVDYIQGSYLAAPSTQMDYDFIDIA